jgi:hypothetical protein
MPWKTHDDAPQVVAKLKKTLDIRIWAFRRIQTNYVSSISTNIIRISVLLHSLLMQHKLLTPMEYNIKLPTSTDSRGTNCQIVIKSRANGERFNNWSHNGYDTNGNHHSLALLHETAMVEVAHVPVMHIMNRVALSDYVVFRFQQECRLLK